MAAKETLVLTEDEAYDLRHEDAYHDELVDGKPSIKYEAIKREHAEDSRWRSYWDVVFKDAEGKFWLWNYDVPATENQEYNDLDCENERTATRVYPREVTVTEYFYTP